MVHDEPIIFKFGDFRFEIEYCYGSCVTIGFNNIDIANKCVQDVTNLFSQNIIGHKVVDFVINKSNKVNFMNFTKLNIARKDSDDMFEEVYIIFDNGYKLEICSDNCDYMVVNETNY